MSTDLPAPYPGAQTLALSLDCDFIMYGGRAGTGKTETLGFYPLHFLRRQLPANVKLNRLNPRDIRDPGGIFDRLEEMWTPYGAIARRGFYHDFTWSLPAGKLRVACRGLDRVGKERIYQGAEVDAFLVEELGEFWAADREAQIFWLMSRHRSGMRVGFRPQLFATLNPCAGWIRRIVDWYIGPDGQPVWERSGKVRWMVRRWTETLSGHRERVFEFADSRDDLLEAFPAEDPVSFSLVSARREDNPFTDWADYERRLKQLDPHERERLLDGNWNARPIDPAQVYHPGPGVFVSPKSQAWRGVVEHSQRYGIRQRGGWDYGRDRALGYVSGVVEPATPPCLWITNAILFPDCEAPEAARIRLREHVDRDLGLLYADSLDFGDPAGRARDSGPGWAATLAEHGVALSDLGHTYGEEEGLWYWNSHAGRMHIRTLVKLWMRTGRLKVLEDVRLVVDGLLNWRRKVPQGVDPLDVDAEDVPPQKSRESHIMDALGYLVAGVAEELRLEAAGVDQPQVDVSMPLARRQLFLDRTGF